MFSIVTGASSGIGLNYATILAKDYKSDLLLISNQKTELDNLSLELSNTYNIKTIPYFIDLSHQNAAEEVFQFCQNNNLVVDVLINNAGMFFFNSFCNTDIKRIETMLNLHMITLTKLCRLFGEQMIKRELSPTEKTTTINGHKRQKGYILNMSSMSAWMAMPGIQTYNATKVFIYNLSKSLWYEFRLHNVYLTVMTPGAVDTTLYGLAPHLRKLAVALHVSIPPQKLAKRALNNLFKGKKADMPGWINSLFVPLIKHLPDWIVFFALKHLSQYTK